MPKGTVRLITDGQRLQLARKIAAVLPADLHAEEAQRLIGASKEEFRPLADEILAALERHRRNQSVPRNLRIGAIIELEVNCDEHTPEFVAKLRGFTGEYQGERFTGQHWFRVRLDKAPRQFTDEESVAWAKTERGGLGVLPGQVAEAFRQKFPLAAKLGMIVFSGGSWRDALGLFRSSVCLIWSTAASYLDGRWFSPAGRWLAGDVFPVVLEHKQL